VTRARAAGEELVSVVVPTRNSARTLDACLRSVRSQTYPRVELIVVDNRSSDGTPEIAARWADLVRAGGSERSAQRNIGAAVARGRHLLFIDSDMRLDPQVVAECVRELEHGSEAVVIPETSVGEGFWARCKALERRCYLGDADIEAARFLRRELFDVLGQYDELLLGTEDWDLQARVYASGARTGRVNAVIHHDEGRVRLRALLAKKFMYGKTAGTYARRHAGRARRQLRVLRPAFLRHRHTLLAEPVLAAGMLFLKMCELAAGGAGLAAATLPGLRREAP
jgi:glycosyltransferase involved in cell wall biosynthesis